MGAPILHLANRWIDSKMLLTPNRFSYLVILLTVAFHWIPQFIAQFCSICPFVCPPLPLRLNCINLRDRAEAAAAHLCPCCHFSLLSPFEETKWRSKKVIKPWILIENGTFEGFSLKSKLFLYRNKTFWFIKLCSMSKDCRDSATLFLIKCSQFNIYQIFPDCKAFILQYIFKMYQEGLWWWGLYLEPQYQHYQRIPQ